MDNQARAEAAAVAVEDFAVTRRGATFLVTKRTPTEIATAPDIKFGVQLEGRLQLKEKDNRAKDELAKAREQKEAPL